MNSYLEAKIRELEKRIESNLKLAEQYSYHPQFEEKFLRQACEAEAKLKELTS